MVCAVPHTEVDFPIEDPFLRFTSNLGSWNRNTVILARAAPVETGCSEDKGIYLMNFKRLGRIAGIISCQSAHDTWYAVEFFFKRSVEAPRKDLVGRKGRDYSQSE